MTALNDKMAIELKKEDIEVAHRVRSWQGVDYCRSILVKFVNRDLRQKVLKKQGKAEGQWYEGGRGCVQRSNHLSEQAPRRL